MSSCAPIIEATDQVLDFSIPSETVTCEIKKKSRTNGMLKDGGASIWVSTIFTEIIPDCMALGLVRQKFKLGSRRYMRIADCLLDLCITHNTIGALNKYVEEVLMKIRNNDLPILAAKLKLTKHSSKTQNL